MNLNPDAIPTFALAMGLFVLGYYAAGLTTLKSGRAILALLGTVFATPGLLFVFYYAHLFDRAVWFYTLRTVSHIEISAAGIAFLAGFLEALLQPQTFGEKAVAPTVAALLLFIPFMKSALDPLNYAALNRTCDGEVCRQSTQSSCGPTSAATLLKLLGASASERELARECFTYRGGTEAWYIARALRRRGFSTSFVIQPADRISPLAPSIAGVVLRGGVGHFIAIMDADADTFTIGDPLVGKAQLSRRELTQQYHFTGFFLVVHPRLQSASGASLTDHERPHSNATQAP